MQSQLDVFTGLFLVIGCVESTGVLERLAAAVVAFAGDSPARLIPTTGVFSAGARPIVDKLPVAATLIPIIKSIGGMDVSQELLWWSLVSMPARGACREIQPQG